jgi:hypothetical protein
MCPSTFAVADGEVSAHGTFAEAVGEIRASAQKKQRQQAGASNAEQAAALTNAADGAAAAAGAGSPRFSHARTADEESTNSARERRDRHLAKVTQVADEAGHRLVKFVSAQARAEGVVPDLAQETDARNTQKAVSHAAPSCVAIK